MFPLAAEHPVLAALGLLLVGWFATFLRKGYKIRKTFHDQVRFRQSPVACHRLIVVVVWTAALMALGSLEGDGRDDGWEHPNDGASSWSVAILHWQYCQWL
jgi:hypothetical protein